MLAYDRSFDPIHCALRCMRIMSASSDPKYEIEKLRILDFYLVFPHKIDEIRLPQKFRRLKKQFHTTNNPYLFTGSSFFLFSQMKIIQETAIRLLGARGIIDIDLLSKGYVSRVANSIDKTLSDLIEKRNTEQSVLIDAITDALSSFPLLGKDGLKDRTGLIDFRYDDA